MSTPCFDPGDDPDGIELDEPRRGDVHASDEWESLEPLAGPEYRMWKQALWKDETHRWVDTHSYWRGHS